MRKIINQSNFVDHHFYEGVATFGERFTLPSLTVPDMVMGLAEMLKRYVRGGQVEVFTPVFSDDPDLDNLEKMDTIDRMVYASELNESIKKHRQTMKKAPVPIPPPPPPPPSSSQLEFEDVK